MRALWPNLIVPLVVAYRPKTVLAGGDESLAHLLGDAVSGYGGSLVHDPSEIDPTGVAIVTSSLGVEASRELLGKLRQSFQAEPLPLTLVHPVGPGAEDGLLEAFEDFLDEHPEQLDPIHVPGLGGTAILVSPRRLRDDPDGRLDGVLDPWRLSPEALGQLTGIEIARLRAEAEAEELARELARAQSGAAAQASAERETLRRRVEELASREAALIAGLSRRDGRLAALEATREAELRVDIESLRPAAEETSDANAAIRSPAISAKDRGALAFWESPVARGFIRERITGDAEVSPGNHLASLLEDSQRGGAGIVLRGGDPELACDLLRAGACGGITILDESSDRLEYARNRIDADLRDRVEFIHGAPISHAPDPRPTVVATASALHRLSEPEDAVARIADWIAPGGWLCADEFVGPDRLQWSDEQIEIVNRLLACLPEELRRDLSDADGRVKESVDRPDAARFAREHSAEAVAGSRVRAALDEHLEPVVVVPYGGAIFHQFFARIMGNFARRPELVRLILEFDAILTDAGTVKADYLWGAYRKPA